VPYKLTKNPIADLLTLPPVPHQPAHADIHLTNNPVSQTPLPKPPTQR
jgi:hypothetical protein